MIHLAACLAGFGGLLYELVAVRRFGLSLGNTPEAASLVLGAFLAGLGVGGAVVARAAALRRRAGGLAALAYLLVAVALAGAALGFAALEPLGWWGGSLAVVALTGVPAVLMGVAFPLLFARVRGRGLGPGLLVAANLAGSVIAALAGGNLLIPEAGLRASHGIAIAAYTLAAVAVQASTRSREALEETAAGAGRPGELAAAFGAGFGVLGLEILLLRRLPFFLEGFLPTLSGVLAACLLWLAAGAAIGPPVFARLCRRAPVEGALLFGAVGCALGLAEHATPALSRLPVSSELGLHLRILLAAGAAAVPCFALGAVVPLCVRESGLPAAERAGLAGRLYLWQGLGALGAALAVGHLLPWLWPAGFFVLAPVAIGVATAAAAARRRAWRPALASAGCVVALGLLGFAGAGTLLHPDPPVRGSRFDRPGIYAYRAHRTDSTVTASVVYDRAHHSMVLFTNEFRAAYTGPGTAYMKVLGHLPFLLRDDLREVAVIALGTGTTADAVCAWPTPAAVHVVEISPAVFELVDHFGGDGPVWTGRPPPFLRDPRTVAHLADGRRWLAGRPSASLDLVTMEPLLPYAPGMASLYSREFYDLVRDRLRPGGLCVQWVPTHAMPEELYATLLETFASRFPHHSAWLIDQSTLLVGSERPHLPPLDVLRARLQRAPDAARTQLHEAGIAGVVDLEAAFVSDRLLGAFAQAEVLSDDRPFVERIGYWSGERRLGFCARNLGLLEATIDLASRDAGWAPDERRRLRRARLAGLRARMDAALELGSRGLGNAVAGAAEARALAPDSVLLHREETLALRALIEREALRVGPGGAARLAEGQLRRDVGSAVLWACAALDRDDGGRNAIEVDPSVYRWLPPFLSDIAPPRPHRSSLEDLAELPRGAELARLASRDDAHGAAVRAAFGVRCARALVAEAEAGPLGPAERAALGPLLDPATWRELGRWVSARGPEAIVTELLPLWRRDLPLEDAVRSLARGGPDLRRALAASLRERRGAAALELLADLLLDDDPAVRRAAGASLFETVGDQIGYDPSWPESRRRVAADRLRALHNRRP